MVVLPGPTPLLPTPLAAARACSLSLPVTLSHCNEQAMPPADVWEPKRLVLAGIPLNVYGVSALSLPSEAPSTASDDSTGHAPIAVLFHLHGRFGSQSDPTVSKFANVVLEYVHSRKGRKKELLVITFDQRNHGERMVEFDRNRGWMDSYAFKDGMTEDEKKIPENVSHAVDMVALQTGTATDVSHLMTYLPAALFPNDEREITDWYISGTSLGGHAAWIVASRDPRVSIVVPIIGSPSALTLLAQRAGAIPSPLGPLPIAPPYFPKSLTRALEENDPCNQPASVWKNKKILVLSGAKDLLVNYAKGGSQKFVEKLKEWENSGLIDGLEVDKWVQDGTYVFRPLPTTKSPDEITDAGIASNSSFPSFSFSLSGHICTDEMIVKTAEWVWVKGIAVA